MFQWAFFRPDDDHHELSILGTIFYYGTNIVALPISYALIFLTINVLFQLYNNLTSLEGMSRRTRKAPCIGAVGGEDYSIPNEYDMIWLTNMKQVLGSRIWMWLLPISEEMKGQGFYYPKIPEITMADMNIMLKESGKTHNTSFSSNDFESDPKEYIKKALKKYSGSTFLIPSGSNGAQSREVYIPSEEEQNQKTIIVE